MFESDTGAKRLAWISSLEQCESQGRTDIKVFDTNKKYSYGILQFQQTTFDRYGELYDLPHDDIYSKEQQEMIALYMLNSGLWKNWFNCGKKIGEYPVDV